MSELSEVGTTRDILCHKESNDETKKPAGALGSEREREGLAYAFVSPSLREAFTPFKHRADLSRRNSYLHTFGRILLDLSQATEPTTQTYIQSGPTDKHMGKFSKPSICLYCNKEIDRHELELTNDIHIRISIKVKSQALK